MPRSHPTAAQWLRRSPSYLLLSAARVLVSLGTQMQAVAMGWLMYDLTSDPLALGLVGLAEAVPALGLALPAGWAVDRGRPRTIYRGAILASAASTLILIFLSADPRATHDLRVGGVYAAAFATGLARAFIRPATFTLLPLIVPRKFVGQGTAWLSSVFQIASLGGPLVGGLVYGFGGPRTTFMAVLALLSAAWLAAGRLRPRVVRTPPRRASAAAELMIGLRFVFNRQVILAAMALDMFAVLFGGAVALFPIFARDVFALGPAGLGLLRAAMPAGSVLAGWYLVRVPITNFAGRHLLYAVAAFGLCMIGFGLSPWFPLSFLLLVAAGIADGLSMVMRGTILQLSTPHALRGRVSAVGGMFIGSSNEIGAFESGVAAKLLGTRLSVVFGGCMTLLIVAFTRWKAPKLAKVELAGL